MTKREKRNKKDDQIKSENGHKNPWDLCEQVREITLRRT